METDTLVIEIAVGKCVVPIVLVSASLFLIKRKKARFLLMDLDLVSREIKEGGRIIVEVDGKVAKIRNLKVSLKLFSFSSPLSL